jgi:hypothetical protein
VNAAWPVWFKWFQIYISNIEVFSEREWYYWVLRNGDKVDG